jgi:hypothetical protein
VTDGERCFIGAEPQNGGRDLGGLAHAADRLLCDDGCAAFFGVAGEAAHHLGVDDAGTDGVDADVRRGVVQRGGLGEADEAVFGGGVGGLALEALDASA